MRKEVVNERELITEAAKVGIERLVVGALLVRRSKILVLRRKSEEFMGGMFELPSGKVEEGETLKDALKREVREETGLTLASVTDTGFCHRYPVRPEWRKWYGEEPEVIEEHVFYALVEPSAEPVLSTEHKSWRWCSLEEANHLLTFGANSMCLQAVERGLAAAA